MLFFFFHLLWTCNSIVIHIWFIPDPYMRFICFHGHYVSGKWIVSFACVWHNSVSQTHLSFICDSYETHLLFICYSYVIHIFAWTLCNWYATCLIRMCVTWLFKWNIFVIHMWYSYVWSISYFIHIVSFICGLSHSHGVTWLIFHSHATIRKLVVCDTINLHATWLIHMWHDSFSHSPATIRKLVPNGVKVFLIQVRRV